MTDREVEVPDAEEATEEVDLEALRPPRPGTERAPGASPGEAASGSGRRPPPAATALLSIAVAALLFTGIFVAVNRHDKERHRTTGATTATTVPTVTTKAGAATTAGRPDVGRDQLRVAGAVLRLEDLGTGWRQQPPDLPDEGLGRCYGLERAGRRTAEGLSGGLMRGQFGSAGSYVALFADDDGARKVFRTTTQDSFSRCILDALSRSRRAKTPPGVTYDPMVASHLSFPDVGARSTAYRITSATRAGNTVPTFLDLIVVQRQRAVAVVAFGDAFRPVATDEEQRAVARVVSRLGP